MAEESEEIEETDFILSSYERMKKVSQGLPIRPYRVRRRKRRDDEDDEVYTDVDESGWKPGPGMARSRTGAGPSRFDPQPVGNLFGALVRKKSWQGQLSLGTVIARWNEIAGESVAKHSAPETLEGSKLLVRTDSTAWAKQLQLLLPQLERRIDEVLGSGAVTQVVVHGPQRPSWSHGKYRVKGRGPRDTYG